MSKPPQPIACLKCNTINYTGDVCKECHEPLKVIPPSEESDDAPQEVGNDVEESQSLQNAAAEVVETASEAPSVPPSMGGKTTPMSGVDKDLARRKLRAKIRDSRSGRMPLNSETEVKDRHGKRIVGARRIPTTVQQPLSQPDTPYERV